MLLATKYLKKSSLGYSEQIREEIINSSSINEFVPISDKNKVIQILEVKPSFNRSDTLYSEKKYSRNVLLYEVRTFIDSLHLLHQSPKSNYMLEINFSYETIEKGFIGEDISSYKKYSSVFKRVIFCIDYNPNEPVERYNTLKLYLKKIEELGFKTMLKVYDNYLPFDYFLNVFDYFKINLKNIPIEQAVSIAEFINKTDKKTQAKTIFSEINNYALYELLTKLGVKYLQGEAVDKAKASVISAYGRVV